MRDSITRTHLAVPAKAQHIVPGGEPLGEEHRVHDLTAHLRRDSNTRRHITSDIVLEPIATAAAPQQHAQQPWAQQQHAQHYMYQQHVRYISTGEQRRLQVA